MRCARRRESMRHGRFAIGGRSLSRAPRNVEQSLRNRQSPVGDQGFQDRQCGLAGGRVGNRRAVGRDPNPDCRPIASSSVPEKTVAAGGRTRSRLGVTVTIPVCTFSSTARGVLAVAKLWPRRSVAKRNAPVRVTWERIPDTQLCVQDAGAMERLCSRRAAIVRKRNFASSLACAVMR